MKPILLCVTKARCQGQGWVGFLAYLDHSILFYQARGSTLPVMIKFLIYVQWSLCVLCWSNVTPLINWRGGRNCMSSSPTSFCDSAGIYSLAEEGHSCPLRPVWVSTRCKCIRSPELVKKQEESNPLQLLQEERKVSQDGGL